MYNSYISSAYEQVQSSNISRASCIVQLVSNVDDGNRRQQFYGIYRYPHRCVKDPSSLSLSLSFFHHRIETLARQTKLGLFRIVFTDFPCFFRSLACTKKKRRGRGRSRLTCKSLRVSPRFSTLRCFPLSPTFFSTRNAITLIAGTRSTALR